MNEVAAGCVGKIPGSGDFITVHGGSPTRVAFDAWLRESFALAAERGVALPPHPLHFIYRAESGDEVLAGCLGPSCDAVGRSFPLAIYRSIPSTQAAAHLPALPLAVTHFIHAAASFMCSAVVHERDAFVHGLSELPDIESVDYSEAEQLGHSALLEASASSLFQRLFGEISAGGQFYGLGTVLAAAERASQRVRGRCAFLLDCPVVGDIDVRFWLALIGQRLGWKASVPTLMWSPPMQRMLVALGAPSTNILYYHGDPMAQARDLWSTQSQDARAIEALRAAMQAPAVDAIEAIGDGGRASVHELLSALEFAGTPI